MNLKLGSHTGFKEKSKHFLHMLNLFEFMLYSGLKPADSSVETDSWVVTGSKFLKETLFGNLH